MKITDEEKERRRVTVLERNKKAKEDLAERLLLQAEVKPGESSIEEKTDDEDFYEDFFLSSLL